ncbi:hypothetical protein O9993_15575 [Vibrio lentus]|nr:hypothetical protein [Vibrio lentus]
MLFIARKSRLYRTRFDGTDVETDRFVGGLFVDYDINVKTSCCLFITTALLKRAI